MQPQEFVIQNLKDYKAKDIVCLNVKKLTDITDYMVICTATSSRHVHTIASNLVSKAKQYGIPPLGVEQDPNGEWTLVDLGDVIVHIMQPQTREFYNLEKLWTVE